MIPILWTQSFIVNRVIITCLILTIYLCHKHQKTTTYMATTAKGRRYVSKQAESLADKQKKAGVKVAHNKVKAAGPGRNTLNRNQAYTSDGTLSQGYNKDTKQFEKTATSTRSGLLAVEGSNSTKGARTWTFTPKNDDGSPIINEKTGKARQSGRSQTATRTQRTYDTKAGLNNISPKVVQAWLDNGMAREVEGGGLDVGGNIIYRKSNGNYSMGLSNG